MYILAIHRHKNKYLCMWQCCFECFLIANQQYVRQGIPYCANNWPLWNLKDIYAMKSLMRAYYVHYVSCYWNYLACIQLKFIKILCILTLNTMSTMHQVFTVTMTDTDFTPFGAFRISFFTYSVPKYPQPFCHRKNYIFINSNFIYKLFVITFMKVEFLDSTLVIINEKNYLRLHEIVEIKKLW